MLNLQDKNVKMALFAVAAFFFIRIFFMAPSQTPAAPRPYGGFQGMRNRREGFAPLEGADPTPPRGFGHNAGSVDPRQEDKILMGDKCTQNGQYISSNLLPKSDPNMKGWSDFAPNPALQGQSLFLEPEKVIGVDTVSNHLRNASYDIRKEPPNPTVPVSPWINSTIGPDLMRKPLEECATQPK